MELKVRDEDKVPGEEPKRLANRKLLPDEQTLTQLRKLAAIQCDDAEAASFFGVAKVTFQKFLQDFPVAFDAWDQGRGLGRIGLRRRQFKMAEKNVAMAIFLGKNYLGQADKTDVGVGGRGDAPPLSVTIAPADRDL